MTPEEQFYQRLHAITSTANAQQQAQTQAVQGVDLYALIERLRRYFANNQQPENYGYWRSNG